MGGIGNRNHVLLIGIDAYPTSPLGGCVNDVRAMIRVLQTQLGVRDDEMTVLASPLEDQVIDCAGPGTAAEIRAALQRLDTEHVQPNDRVIIHYSGHGASRMVEGKRRHVVECLVPVDHVEGNDRLLYDVEINRCLAAIARRTHNLTVVFDCCHSAGVSRDPWEAIRVLTLGPITDEHLEGPSSDTAPTRLGQRIKGKPLVLAACLADEVAGECVHAGRHMGKLTRALCVSLESLPPGEIGRYSWRELWPRLLSATSKQHPRLLGDDRRGLFESKLGRDPGDVHVQPRTDGSYDVSAGTLLDVGEGAELGVYGGAVARLPPTGSPDAEVARLARLRVIRADREQAQAELVDAIEGFSWPDHARCRIERYADPRLRVAFQGAAVPDSMRERLADLRIDVVEEAADVRLIREGERADDWLLWDDRLGSWSESSSPFARMGELAVVPILEHCIRWQLPLRLAERCASHELELRVLDATPPIADPQDHDGHDLASTDPPGYRIAFQHRFCVEVFNLSDAVLHVSLLGVGSDGVVVMLGHETIAAGTAHIFWNRNVLGEGFWFEAPAGVERIVAIGTTSRSVAFDSLETDPEVDFESILAGVESRGGFRRTQAQPAPAVRWTAAVLCISST